jgi:hypothetical protein
VITSATNHRFGQRKFAPAMPNPSRGRRPASRSPPLMSNVDGPLHSAQRYLHAAGAPAACTFRHKSSFLIHPALTTRSRLARVMGIG